MRILLALAFLISCGHETREKNPIPQTEPQPEPKPEPKPEPQPEPTPQPKAPETQPQPEPSPQPEPKPEPRDKSYVDIHGFLGTDGNRIVDERGEPVQLKGMSLFWSQWSGQWWTPSAVETTKSWGATVIRAAMGVEMGGYLSNPDAETDRVRTIVDAAVDHGIYVIIDWHAHGEHRDEAVAFFREMARDYKDVPNVIFELWNEPINESWGTVKGYAEAVTGAIRAEGAKHLVIVGSPSWSQRVDLAADDPVGYEDVAYAVHFYAATHKEWLREKVRYALGKGAAIFATEWGTCDASGNGYIDLAESQAWLDFLDEHKIGWANWSLHDKPESASALEPGSSPDGIWRLTRSGEFVWGQLGKHKS